MYLAIFLCVVVAIIAQSIRAICRVYQALPIEKKNTVAFVKYGSVPIALLPIGLVERYFPNMSSGIYVVFTDKSSIRHGCYAVFANSTYDKCQMQSLRLVRRIVAAISERPRDTINRFLMRSRADIAIKHITQDTYLVTLDRCASDYISMCTTDFVSMGDVSFIERYVVPHDPRATAFLATRKKILLAS